MGTFGMYGHPLWNARIPLPAGGGRVDWFPRAVGQRLLPPNGFNSCLADEARLWAAIHDCGGLQALCPGMPYTYAGKYLSDPPWVKQPDQGKRFSRIGSIALPPFDGLDHQVLNFLVPLGFDGVIVSTVNIYTGMGFAEGSGDLTWRIQINERYVKDYGAITTSIGSLQTPYNINSGAIRLQSRQLVQCIVSASVAAAGNLNGGRIICGLFGWTYPR